MLDEAGVLLSWGRRKVDLLLEFHFARSSFLYIDKSCSTSMYFLVKAVVFIQKAHCLGSLACLFVFLFQETLFPHAVSVGFTKRSKFPSSPFSRERRGAVSKGILAK